MSLQTEQELESAYVMNTFARKPVELVRGEGMAVFDDAGREYLDFIGGIGASAWGTAIRRWPTRWPTRPGSSCM